MKEMNAVQCVQNTDRFNDPDHAETSLATQEGIAGMMHVLYWSVLR